MLNAIQLTFILSLCILILIPARHEALSFTWDRALNPSAGLVFFALRLASISYYLKFHLFFKL